MCYNGRGECVSQRTFYNSSALLAHFSNIKIYKREREGKRNCFSVRRVKGEVALLRKAKFVERKNKVFILLFLLPLPPPSKNKTLGGGGRLKASQEKVCLLFITNNVGYFI